LNEPVSEIDTVANSIANVNTVGSNIASVQTVAGIAGDVNTVAGVAPNVTTVAGISANVTTVAGVSANVTTVAGISSNVTTVAGISADVTAVAGVAADIPTVAANVADISNFADVYQGAKSTPPTLRNDGGALQIGDLYFNSVSNAMFVYASTGWVPAGSSVNGTSRRFRYIATAGQTTFTGTDSNGNTMAYDAGFVDVYLNGVRLDQTDYTASSGTSIVLASAAALNDELNIVAFGTFSVASINGVDLINGTITPNKLDRAYVNKAGDTMTGDLVLDQALASNIIKPAFLQNTSPSGNLNQGVQLSFGNDVGSSTPNPSGYIRTVNASGASNASAMQFGGYTGSGQQNHMTIDPNGRVLKPYTPAFRAFYFSTSIVLPSGDIPFDTAPLNIGNSYNTSNGRFTAPVSGIYQINLAAQHSGGTATGGYIDFRLNGAETRCRYEHVTGATFEGSGLATCIYMNAGDYITCNASANVFWSHNTCFSGQLIG